MKIIIIHFSFFIQYLCLLLYFSVFIKGSNSEAQAFLQRDGQIIIRMRGLPFDASAKDVVSIYDLYIAICA